MKHSALMLKSIVIAVSFALTACGGGGSGVHSNSTETGGKPGGTDPGTGNQTPGDGENTPNVPLPVTPPPVNPSPVNPLPVNPDPDKHEPVNPTPIDPADNIPVPSSNPSRMDSTESAIKVPLSKNQYPRSVYGEDNTQANLLNLKDARDQGLDGKGVKVGIVDLPVDVNHPALPDNVVDLGQFGTPYNGKAYPHWNCSRGANLFSQCNR